ncbi:MAG TPA: hypothetical protein EYP88_02245, partial [Anaerolineales bacterium]|nr:hypothetical protein [Anaerolineales bacterium]
RSSDLLEQGNLVMEGDAEQVVSQYIERNKEKAEARLQKKRALQKKHEAPKRWGNRKVEIVDVRILNAHDAEQRIFKTGDELHLRIRYRAHEPIPDAVFGMAIHNHQGVHITGPNTQVAGLHLPPLEGEGEVLCNIHNLSLLNGLYHVSVAIVNEADTDTYDYHNRQYDFRVDNADTPGAEKFGLVTLGVQWQFLGK